MDRFLKEALKEARQGLVEGGIPIGSVLVDHRSSVPGDGSRENF